MSKAYRCDFCGKFMDLKNRHDLCLKTTQFEQISGFDCCYDCLFKLNKTIEKIQNIEGYNIEIPLKKFLRIEEKGDN